MDRVNKRVKQYSEGQHDDKDCTDSSQRIRRPVRQPHHDVSHGIDGIEILESPGIDDSAYHTFSQSSFSKSTSAASSDRFPSEESLRSGSLSYSSTSSSNKKNHSTLIRIQLGDDKKISHEWYSQFTSQSHHNQAFNSPLANRVTNSSSQFEYDSHIAHMRGNLICFVIRLMHINIL